MWSVCVLILGVVWLIVAWRRGPDVAVGATTLLSLLVPTWVTIDLLGAEPDVRIAAGALSLGLYCLHPRASLKNRVVLVDCTAIVLAIVHLMSDVVAEGYTWFLPLRIYGEWAVPYLAGRLAIQNWEDSRSLVPFVVAVCCCFAVLAVIESVARFNVLEQLFGERPLDRMPRELTRWGLRRAYVSVKNPIYFGSLLVLLAPWTCYAAAHAVRGSGSRWWLLTPLTIVVGIVCSASRAPLLALVPLAYVLAYVNLPARRRVFQGIGLAGIMLLAVFHRPVVDTLQAWSGAAAHQPAPTITVGGQQVEYNVTMHRVYLLEVYGTAIKRAGLLGFGTDRTATFPPRVPVGPEHAETIKRLWNIDNFYVLFILRFGYLGLASFIALAVAAAVTFYQLGNQTGFRHGAFAGAMAGATIALLMILATVWMPHDFGFWFMWNVGACAGLYSHREPFVAAAV